MNRTLGARHCLVLLLLGVSPAPALAQSGEGTQRDTSVVPLEGVTVTGSRTSERLLKTPAAVSIVSRERMLSTRQLSLADGLTRVPGVFTQSRGGAQDVRITIRGYGARGNGERSNAGNMRGIRILTDGIPLTEPDGRTSLEFVDLGGIERVEVLRSNGSVLYGNASGGVVNLRTSQDFEKPYLDLHSRAGSFGFHREQAVVGYTVGRARGTLSAYTSTFDGWRAHSGSSTTSVQNRLALPIDEVQRLGLLLDYVTNHNRYPGALTADQLAADPAQANATYVERDERRFNRVGRVGVTFDRDLEGAQKLSVATWVEPKILQRSERNRFRDFTRYHLGGSVTWQVQRSIGSDWQSIWMAGADEQYQDGAIQFYNVVAGARGTDLVANQREAANSTGGFLQTELRNDQWSFRLGCRYDNLWYISEDRIDPDFNASKHFTQITPKASIARYFGQHTLYGSVGGGVETPAFNEIDPPPPFDTLTSLNPFLDPMQSTSYEAGAKGDLVREGGAIGRLAYDASLYWIDVANDIVPFDGGAYFLTAGKSRRRGAELGLDWIPIRALSVGGSLTLSKNEYIDYADFDGNDVAGLPAVFADGEVRWRVAQGFSVMGTVRHVGKYFADDANAASVEPFNIFGAEAEYVRPMPFGLVRVFVSGENLTDEAYVASVFINGINSQYYEPGLPASFAAGLSVSLR